MRPLIVGNGKMQARVREVLVFVHGERARQGSVPGREPVTPANARKILALPRVDGSSVNGASLDGLDVEAIRASTTTPIV